MTTEEKAAPKPKELTMTDWQEAYFDLLNKVECDCVQQGDLVPIWDQFKRMNLTITKLQGHQAALEAELAAMKARGEELNRLLPQEHWTTKGAIKSARELIKAANALCLAAETSGGTAGHDAYLSAAIANWAAEREKHKQVLRIIELEGHNPEIGAGVPARSFRQALTEWRDQ